MCGRYASFLPAEALARIFGTVNPLPNLAPSWNNKRVAIVRYHPETGAHSSRAASSPVPSLARTTGRSSKNVAFRCWAEQPSAIVEC
jgi:hypothetical protein